MFVRSRRTRRRDYPFDTDFFLSRTEGRQWMGRWGVGHQSSVRTAADVDVVLDQVAADAAGTRL